MVYVMKRRYKKYGISILCSFIFIILIIILLVNITIKKYNTYTTLSALVINNELINLVVNDKELKYLQTKKEVFIDGKKKNVEIVDVFRDVLENKHEIYLSVKTKYKDKEIIEVSIFNKKEKIINMFIKSLEV